MAFHGGWTRDERDAMVEKLEKFYHAFYREKYGVKHEEAEGMASRSMRTLQYQDIFTMREIFRLLYEAAGCTDALVKRNLLVSVFALLLVYDENDPTSWTLARLHKLWKETMTEN